MTLPFTYEDVIEAVTELTNYPTLGEIALFLKVDPTDDKAMRQLSATLDDLVDSDDLEKLTLSHCLDGSVDISIYRKGEANPNREECS